jgi:D-cysteine desulfhydrase
MSGALDRTRASRPLFEVWPRLEARVPLAALGELPTPIESLEPLARALRRPGAPVFVKRDDVTSPIYGGNKVRTLEVLFGVARARGATHIWSTGAYGSNHAAATVLHAPRAGLASGVLLFPQPVSWAALENLRVVLAQRPEIRALPHWVALPFGMFTTARSERRRGHEPSIMVPGGATPHGALGYVSAALELARQVADGELPPPKHVVIGVGSTCTSAGLLVGFAHAARLGIGFVDGGKPAPPELVSVRVTPWPVTSRFRIVGLAQRTSRLLAELADDPSLELESSALARLLRVDGSFLGRGYGLSTDAGREALQLWHDAGLAALDTTYSGKSAAAVVARVRAGLPGPLVFWSTKSSVPLPRVEPGALDAAPARMQRWIARAERELSKRGELPPAYPGLARLPGV